jgi:hypothetical protein
VLGVLTWFTFEPQDLSDIDGYGDNLKPRLAFGGRDLGQVLETAERNGQAVTITEGEINAYLSRTLRARQEGLFKDFVELKGVWVRLDEGQAEVILEREINGQWRHTVSMVLPPEQEMGENGAMKTSVSRSTGRFGRVRVVRGFLLLTKDSFESLASAYSEELGLLKRMFHNKVEITITDDELSLSRPRP